MAYSIAFAIAGRADLVGVVVHQELEIDLRLLFTPPPKMKRDTIENY